MITATVSILILKHYNYLCETPAVPTLTWMHVEQEFYKVHCTVAKYNTDKQKIIFV